MNCHTVFNCVGHNHELTDNRIIKETVLKYVNEAEFKELFTIAALEKIETVTSSAISATSSAIKASLDARNAVNDLTVQTIDFVNDAINNTAVEGGVLADTFLTLTSQGGSTPRNLRDKMVSLLDAKDFGAVGDKVTDDTAAIKRYIAYCKTQTPCRFLLPTGKYLVSETITLDLPNSATIIFEGNLISSVEHEDLLVIGSETVNHFNYSLTNISAEHISGFSNISTDTTRTCAAVRLLNIVGASGNISRASGCWHGVLGDSSAANGGMSYNQIHLGLLKDNVIPMRLMARAPNGYTNENTFFGGSMGHSGSFPYTGEEVDIVIDQSSGIFNLNNNLFFRPSLESNNAASKAAKIGGAYNSIYMPRVENSKNYGYFPIEFMEGSANCSVLGGGFGLKGANILDNGFSSKYNTSTNNLVSGAAEVGTPVLEVRNTNSSLGEAIAITNTSKAKTLTFYGDGRIKSNSSGYFQTGIRWQTGDSSNLNQRGIFLGNVAPNDVASAYPASIYLNTATGAGYLKKGQAGLTGWQEIVTALAVSTTNRPANPSGGYSMFDTTIGKPIWWSGTKWVDATGVVV